MSLPVIADTYRCALNWKYGALSATNVIHVRTTLGHGGDVAEQVADDFPAGFGNVMTDGCELDSMDVIPLDGSSAGTTVPASSFAILPSGGYSSAGLPACAVVVQLHTALRGRSYRGRVFLPFVAEQVASAGLIPDADKNQVAAKWANFVINLLADQLELVVASYLHSTAQAVTAITVDNVLGTQRRRQDQLRH